MNSYVLLRKNHLSASGIEGFILSILDKDIVVINKLWLTEEIKKASFEEYVDKTEYLM